MQKAHSARPQRRSGNKSFSIIVPVFNEQEVIAEFHRRLMGVLDKILNYNCEVVYVNDGSRDQSRILIQKLVTGDQRIQLIDLSRNFGKEAAMTAGLDHVCGDAVIIIDADLQDPPELIPNMLEAWAVGNEMVCMQRLSRDGESFLKKFTARVFYSLIGYVGQTHIPENVGDFRLMSRSVVDALNKLPERTRFMKGLFAWVGFKTCFLPYHRDARYAGVTKWNYWRLWNLALEGFTSFTVAPLKVASYVGVLTSVVSLGYGATILVKTLIYGDPVPGYPSLMVVMLFLGGLQLLAIGIVGEYLGRIFIETKQRPLYLKSEQFQSHSLSRLHQPSAPQVLKEVSSK